MSPKFSIVGLAVFLVTNLSGCGQSSSALTPPSVSAEEWDVGSWQPHAPLKRPILTDEQKMQARQEWLDSAVRRGAQPRNLPVIRWTVPAEFGELLMVEYVKYGIEATFKPPFGVAFTEGVPESQESLLAQIDYDLLSQYPLEPIYLSDYSPEQLGMLYDYWSEYYVPCVNAHSIQADPAPVSREVFVSTFFDEGVKRWWPSDATMMMEQEVKARLHKTCPEMPPAKYFYGE